MANLEDARTVQEIANEENLPEAHDRQEQANVWTKACIACREPILPDATLCIYCKSDQSPWRNELRYWAAVAGIFSREVGVSFPHSF
jgi:hypothetical protein